MVRVNGKDCDMAGRTVEDCLAELGFPKGRVVAELNEEIVPKAGYKEVFLKDGDVLEIVCFMGGG